MKTSAFNSPTVESENAIIALAECNSVDVDNSPGTLMTVESSSPRRDRSLAPIHLHELRDAMRVLPSRSGFRCSDRGFLNMSAVE